MKIRRHKRARRPLALALVLGAVFTFVSALNVSEAATPRSAVLGARSAGGPSLQFGRWSEDCRGEYLPIKGQGLSCRIDGGLWKVRLRDGDTLVTHGADPADLANEIDAPAVPNPNARAPLCPSQNPNGANYMVAIVAWPSDRVPNETDPALRTRIRNINGHLHEAAVESGSSSGADFVFDCTTFHSGPFGLPKTQIRVDRVALPTASASADFSTITGDLRAKGYNKRNEKYLVYYDDRGPKIAAYCGQGGVRGDEQDTAANANNVGPSFAVSYDCSDRTIMHELGHNLGAVQYNAPHATGTGWHCWESLDVMCYSDGGDRDPGSLLSTCLDFSHFDCGHDDYFDAKIGAGAGVGAGAYLDRNWNLGSCYVRWIVNHSCFAFPSNVVVSVGGLVAGNATQLVADDDSYFQVSSARLFPDSPGRMTFWYGKFTGVPRNPTNLGIVYKGKNSASCTQKVALWRWDINTWSAPLDSRVVGTTETDVVMAVPRPLDRYVSRPPANGELRVRLLCEATSSFTTSADLLKIYYGT